MNWNNKPVLITGAGGFIGSHLTELLIDLKANVKAFVRYNSRNDWGLIEMLPKEKIDALEVIQGDLRDTDAINQASKNVDIIFHLGAMIAIPYSYLHPRETIETNIMGTLNILSAAKENEIEKVVHTSTSEVYGTAKYVPINEEHPLQGQSPYSASKIGADQIAESFFRSYDLPVAIVRPFNTYGPRQSARAVIPAAITQALSGNKVFLGSTSPTRDLTFVEDTVRGFIKAAETSAANGEVINLGTGTEISIGDLVNKIISIIDRNRDIEIIQDKKRIRPKASEVERLLADTSKAKEILAWEPKITLDEGLSRTIKWISQHLQTYKTEMYVV